MTLPDAREHAECLAILAALRDPVLQACAQTLYACGLRISEGRELPCRAVDGKKLTLLVHGKGAKDRLVPLPEALYLRLRRVWTLHRHPHHLFAKKSVGNPVSYSAVHAALKLACQHVGARPLAPHTLRHSFATRLLERGVPAPVVQMLMGHANPRTTQRYLHLTVPLQDGVRRHQDDLFA